MRFKLMTLCKLLKFLISSKENLSKLKDHLQRWIYCQSQTYEVLKLEFNISE